jgi:hypothetical protein
MKLKHPQKKILMELALLQEENETKEALAILKTLPKTRETRYLRKKLLRANQKIRDQSNELLKVDRIREIYGNKNQNYQNIIHEPGRN